MTVNDAPPLSQPASRLTRPTNRPPLPTARPSMSTSSSGSSVLSTSSGTSSSINMDGSQSASSKPPGLARRQSASFNHVRSSSLVSSSPWKQANPQPLGPKYRPAPVGFHSDPQPSPKVPAVSRSASDETNPKEDENASSPRKSRPNQGVQSLSKAEQVSRSPFLDGHRAQLEEPSVPISDRDNIAPISPETFETPPETPNAKPTPPSITIPARHLPPTPSTPPYTPPRITAFSSPAPSPSQKSNLVSKRFHGPRSRSASSTSEHSIKHQRRKTVTFDERCDVLEFDQDEHSDTLLTDADDGGDVSDREQDSAPWTESSGPSPAVSDTIESIVNSLLAQDKDLADREDHNREDEDIPATTSGDFHHTHEAHFFSPSVQNTSADEDSVPAAHNQTRSLSRTEDSENQETRDFELDNIPNSEPIEETSALHGQIDSQEYTTPAAVGTPSIPRTQALAYLSNHHLHKDLPPIIDDADSSTQSAYEATTPSGIDLTEIDDVQSALDRFMSNMQRDCDASYISNTATDVDEELDDISILQPLPAGQKADPIPPSTFHDAKSDSTTEPETETETDAGPHTPQFSQELQSLPTEDKSDLEESNHFEGSSPPPVEKVQFPSSLADIEATNEQSHDISEKAYENNETSSSEVPQTSHEAESPQDGKLRPISLPPPTRRNTIRLHEEKIKIRRRQMREEQGVTTKRRAISMGNADDFAREMDDVSSPASDGPLPPLSSLNAADSVIDLQHAVDRELARRFPDTQRKYHLKERESVIYASDDKISHVGCVGDVDSGRAWRAVKRPSDMNEYAQEIKSVRAQANSEKGHGKIFVRVRSVKIPDLPMPSSSTQFSCLLNNGIHYVETPSFQLLRDSSIEQEFELIENEQLEFMLLVKIHKDPHIAALLEPSSQLPARSDTPSSTKSGIMRGIFGPKKKTSKPIPTPPPRPTDSPDSRFAKYLRRDLVLGRTLVAFKEIAQRCDAKLFESSFPLFGQYVDDRAGVAKPVTQRIGEISLQIFRLPPIPGISTDELPQSLEDCHLGLRHLQWHKTVHHEGHLTQLGGDCTTWRRRRIQVVGATLIAYNDVTNRPVATIDLRKATDVEEEGGGPTRPTAIPLGNSLQVPQRVPKKKSSFNALRGVDHAFRLVFADDEISFFADTQEEKLQWLKVLRGLLGKAPPNPLWAELLWQQARERDANLADLAEAAE